MSRRRILEAAAAIAGERGFEGTTINLVSERSGLPASSIYWHFKDKDRLNCRGHRPQLGCPDRAPRSTGRRSADANPTDLFHVALRRTGSALEEFPDFLRLGLMLILEHRPEASRDVRPLTGS